MSLSIIIPTIGRESLIATLRSAIDQVRDHDEILVVHDGPRPTGDALWHGEWPHAVWLDSGPHNDWGAACRNYGMKCAACDYLMFMDDDDCYAPDALEHVRQAIAKHPGAIFFFQMHYPREKRTLWVDKEIRSGNMGSPMLVMPREANRPQWDGRFYDQDFRFFRDLVAANPDREVIWVEKVIALIKP